MRIEKRNALRRCFANGYFANEHNGHIALILVALAVAFLFAIVPSAEAAAARQFNQVYNDGSGDYMCEDSSMTVNVTNPGVAGYVLEETLSTPSGWVYTGLADQQTSNDCAFTANKTVCSNISNANKYLTFIVSNSPGAAVPNTVQGVIFDSSSPSGGPVAGLNAITVKANSGANSCSPDADSDSFYGPAPLNVCGCILRAQQDCNDLDPYTFPGAPEACGNGLDENCNGPADDTCLSTVTRSAPEGVLIGGNVTVTLTVDWTGAEASVSINETYNSTVFSCTGADLGVSCSGGSILWTLPNPPARTTLTYNLTASTDGNSLFRGTFQFTDKSLSKTAGREVITAYGFGDLTGEVQDTAGRDISQATVRTYPEFYTTQSANSLADGTYSIADVPSGLYYMSASKTGYLQDLKFMPVQKDVVNTVDFTLENGTCNADCTTSLGRCNAGCNGTEFNDGAAKCEFYDFQVMAGCNNKRKGSTVLYNVSGNYTYLVDCCEGVPYPVYSPVASVSGSMRDLIKYTRIAIYQSRPVKFIVAVWE